MNDMEKQIKRTFANLTAELSPPENLNESLILQLTQESKSYTMFVRIPVALSFFTTIIAVPISVY